MTGRPGSTASFRRPAPNWRCRSRRVGGRQNGGSVRQRLYPARSCLPTVPLQLLQSGRSGKVYILGRGWLCDVDITDQRTPERAVPVRCDRARLDRPRQDVLFDVEHNEFWLNEWGSKPEILADAMGAASAHVLAAPKLIPVYSHRMMPDEPHLPGNTVLSAHQTDIICYGFNLADYFRHEFGLPGREKWPEALRPIRFWEW